MYSLGHILERDFAADTNHMQPLRTPLPLASSGENEVELGGIFWALPPVSYVPAFWT